MKKVLMLLAMLSMSTPVFANDCARMINSIDGLSNKAKQELVVNCEQTKLSNVTTPKEALKTDAVVENMDKYSDIALKFAKAIGIAAKELGVAVNEFVNTTAGMLTVGFIAYQLFGSTLSFAFLACIGLILTNRLMSRLRSHLVFDSENQVETTNMFGHKKIKTIVTKKSWNEMYDSANAWFVLSFVLEVIVISVVLINIPI